MRKFYALSLALVAPLFVASSAHADDRPWGPATGDLSLTYPNPQVSGLLSHALPSLSVGCLQYNGSAWVIAACGSGSFTAAGDLSGSGSTQEVIGILSNTLPSLSAGYLHWN